MTFQKFWTILCKRGESPEGDRYSVTSDDRLHILSPRNKNLRYRLTKATAQRYFTLIPQMTENDFRYSYSAYFHNIYRAIMRHSCD